MSENCTHDCANCSENCSSREIQKEAPHPMSKIKKVIGVSLICFTAFVLRNLYAIVGAQVIAGFVYNFINAFPNCKVIGYSYGEQMRDVLPAFGLAASAFAAGWPVGMLALPNLVLVLLQLLVFAGVYLGLAWLFQVEEFTYLLKNVRQMLGKRRA